MLSRRLLSFHLQHFQNLQLSQKRNIQVSIIGAASDIGSNLALLLKGNSKLSNLNLYDDDRSVKGIGTELSHLPGGPEVKTFDGNGRMEEAIRSSDLIVMVARMHRMPGYTRNQMLGVNAPLILRLCRAVANLESSPFLAISTNPINSLLPFASTVMFNYGCYNPCKLFGVTHIDTLRSRAFVAKALKVKASDLYVPVIGGHSDKTIIPLFSNLYPSKYQVDPCHADMLTRLVRKAGTEVVLQKRGLGSSSLAMSWSIHEFVTSMIDAINGAEVTVDCFTANPNFGTRFFAGPTVVSPRGIVETCCNFTMSEYETYLLNRCVPVLNLEISQGEDVHFVENFMRF